MFSALQDTSSGSSPEPSTNPHTASVNNDSPVASPPNGLRGKPVVQNLRHGTCEQNDERDIDGEHRQNVEQKMQSAETAEPEEVRV